MSLNCSDAYSPVNDDSPLITAFGGAQCCESRSTKRAYAEPSQDDIDRYDDIFPIVIRNVLTKRKIREAALKHSAKSSGPEIMIEVYEPS